MNSPYSILKAAPSSILAGQQLVSFARKSTKNQPVADGDKYRAVVVAAFSLPTATFQVADAANPEEVTLTDAPEVFNVAIRETFDSAASGILLDYCKANPKAETIPAEMLEFSAILAAMEASQTSQRLNQETIFAWYDASNTKKEAETRYTDSEKGKKQQANLRAKYGAVASNNSGIDAALAVKMIAYIHADDLTNSTCAAVVKKLERLTKESIDSDEL